MVCSSPHVLVYGFSPHVLVYDVFLTLADRLYAKGVIAFNIKEKVEGCRTAKEKNRALIAAVQQQVGVNPISFQTFIDALNMDKSNESVVSLLTGKGLRFGNKYLPPPPLPLLGEGGGCGRAWGWWRDDSL